MGARVSEARISKHAVLMHSISKDSTVKEVSSLLDSQPRWLHPKNREEMENKLLELAKCKKQRKFMRQLLRPVQPQKSNTSNSDLKKSFGPSPLDKKFSLGQQIPFSECPLEDLLAIGPNELLTPAFTPPPAPLSSTVSPLSLSPAAVPDDTIIHHLLPQRSPSQFHNSEQPDSGDKLSYPPFNIDQNNHNEFNEGLYGFHDIARGRRGLTVHTYYQCLICNRSDSHTSSYADQMICAYNHGRDRISQDSGGLTPAQALITTPRCSLDGMPESSSETAELFRILFPEKDYALENAIKVLDPAGHSLIYNITMQGFTEILDYIFEELGVNLEDEISSHLVEAGPSIEEKVRESTYMSTSSLKERLPRYSARYLKGVARLIKVHSVADSSVVLTARLTCSISATVTGLEKNDREVVKTTHERATSDLADSILTLDDRIKEQGICIPGLAYHDSRTCWCHVADSLKHKVWVNNSGLSLSNVIMDPPQNLANLDLQFRDAFGNSVLHMLAARGANIAVIIDALEQGVDPNSRNSAGQNFLHVLRYRVLRNWATNPHLLIWVLQRLNTFNVNFNVCDPYGRTFFHLLTYHARNLADASFHVSKFPNRLLSCARDAFNWVVAFYPLPVRTSEAVMGSHEGDYFALSTVTSTENLSQDYCDSSTQRIQSEAGNVPLDSQQENSHPGPMVGSFSTGDASGVMENTTFLLKQARLLETARLSIEDPSIQDDEGRNGLQCLARAPLAWDINKKEMPAGGSNKRKAGQNDPTRSVRMTLRFELVKQMIASGIDVNQYDSKGDTVLMTFVTHLPDGEDDKTVASIVDLLIHRGANLHRRNRSGETALHIAVRLGRKVATRVLLINGANPHARTSKGKGILALGERSYFEAREKPALYASIMACMALCIKYGAVAAPTLVQEWSVSD